MSLGKGPFLFGIGLVAAVLAAGCGEKSESWGEIGDLECTNTSGDRWICRTGDLIYQCQFTNGQIDFNLDCIDVTSRLRS